MDITKLKQIFQKVERLAIDTQPIRDLIIYYQKKEINIKNYLHLLETLTVIIDAGNFQDGSAPAQVKIIIDQLKEKISNRGSELIEDGKSTSSGKISDKDLAILATLVDIKKDLDFIKSRNNVTNIVTTKEVDKLETEKEILQSIQLDRVFVNPILNIDSIKGKVIVDEKVEENANNKLAKLKQLKRS